MTEQFYERCCQSPQNPPCLEKKLAILCFTISTSHFSRSHRRPPPFSWHGLPISLKSPHFDVFDDQMGVNCCSWYSVPFLPPSTCYQNSPRYRAIPYPPVGDDSHIKYWYLSKGYSKSVYKDMIWSKTKCKTLPSFGSYIIPNSLASFQPNPPKPTPPLNSA